MIEPYQNEIENELQEFLSGKLRTAIKYSEDGIKEKATEDGRRTVIGTKRGGFSSDTISSRRLPVTPQRGSSRRSGGSSTTTKTRKKSTTDRVNSGDRGQARAGDPRGRSGHVKRVPGRKTALPAQARLHRVRAHRRHQTRHQRRGYLGRRLQLAGLRLPLRVRTDHLEYLPRRGRTRRLRRQTRSALGEGDQ